MLDPVRFLSNLSTGEMGYALARTAKAHKYQVTLVTGPVSIKPPKGIKVVSVVSAKNMQKACQRLFPKQDLLIMSAAVCDFTAASMSRHKIRRTKTNKLLLKKTPDIIAGLAKRKGKRKVIGFCLETENWLSNAEQKIRRKSLDGMVANYYTKKHTPFGNRKIHTALIDSKGRVIHLRNVSKAQVASRLLRWIEAL